MPIKNYLTPEEKLELQQQLKSHEHSDIRERILGSSGLDMLNWLYDDLKSLLYTG